MVLGFSEQIVIGLFAHPNKTMQQLKIVSFTFELGLKKI